MRKNKNEKESKEHHMERLKKTAVSLPAATVKNAVMSMHNRVRKVAAADGGLFNDGGVETAVICRL